jgi:hypothetical protein
MTSRPLAGILLTCAAFAANAGEDRLSGKSTADTLGGRAKTTYVCQMANYHHMPSNGPAKEYDKPGICPRTALS